MHYPTATVTELSEALAQGETTAVALLGEARKVIAKHDGAVRAFVSLYDSADRMAQDADAMRAAGRAGPLTGIPIAIKDNFCVKGEPVTAGSALLEGFTAPYDASVIALLRELGAVLVGRTNMDEFAMGSSTEHSVYGVTRNPHDPDRVSGGSSGGSAAAVAMGAVPLALGSDTGGSVRQPASFCGVYGLKPTYGALSRYGLIALGSSLDVVGLFARTAEDASLLFRALSKEDTFDQTFDRYGQSDLPKRSIIGVPEELSALSLPETTLARFTAAIESLRSRGSEIRSISLPLLTTAGAMYYIIQPAEASSNLARFDGVRYGRAVRANSLWGDYIASRSEGFGSEVVRRIVVGTHVLSAGYYDAYYRRAEEARALLRSQFLSALKEVSLIALPTTPDVAFSVGAIRDPVAMYAEDRLTLQANLTGLPALSIPLPDEAALPCALQCIAGYGREDLLFACAQDVAASLHP